MVHRILRRSRGGRRRLACLCFGSLVLRASCYRPITGSSVLQQNNILAASWWEASGLGGFSDEKQRRPGPRSGGSPPRRRDSTAPPPPGPKWRWTVPGTRLRASIVQPAEAKGLVWDGVEWDTGQGSDKLELGALFAVRAMGKTVLSEDCSFNKNSVNSRVDRFSATLDCEGLGVDFSVEVMRLPSGGEAMRTRVKLGSSEAAAKVGLMLLKACKGCPPPVLAGGGEILGMPVMSADGRFVLGAEHPLAKNLFSQEASDYTRGVGQLSETPAWVSEVSHGGEEWGAVIVAAPERTTQRRRAFAEYLEAARHPSAWTGPIVHYNSWFDFHSWQEKGVADIARMHELEKDVMCEKSILDRIDSFKELTNRGAPFHSFMLDDGWDSPDALWTPQFPLDKISKKLEEELGAGLGIWLSPWGGYGEAKERRKRIARDHDPRLETNLEGLSLAGPNYARLFKEAVLDFTTKTKVNMFKFDGFAGDDNERPKEVEAMLSIIADVRNECSSAGGSADNKCIWINLTTGTWQSPFFLLWADSIWRGYGDLGMVRGSTSTEDSALVGLSDRQRWQVWRECIVHNNFVAKSPLFPMSRLMLHGAVLGTHGEALTKNLNRFNEIDWAQEVWSLAAMGLQLQELYVSPELMKGHDWAWDELAKALMWAKEYWQVLQDAHWVVPPKFPDNCESAPLVNGLPPYVIGAYSQAPVQGVQGILMLRNPMNIAQDVPVPFNLTGALELPTGSDSGYFTVTAKRSISPSPAFFGDQGDARLPRDPIAAKANIVLRMHPAELLVLHVMAA